jgi:alpha-tubulin suppressor-like RCC1 family protein
MRRVSGLFVVAVFACGLLIASCAPAVVPPGSSTTTTSTSSSTTSTTASTLPALPDAPRAGDDSSTTAFGTAISNGTTRGNDTGTGPLVTTLIDNVLHGTLTLVPATGGFSYTPAPAYAGSDTFTYRISDSYGQQSNTARVTITVEPLGVATISAGSSHTCVVMTDSTARCWGDNTYGQLGNDTTVYSTVPVTVVDPSDRVSPLSGIVSISAGYWKTCAVLVDSTARCWGYGPLGNLRNGQSNSRIPVKVSFNPSGGSAEVLTGIASISAAVHICVVMLDSTARCWGENLYGALGTNSFTYTNAPMQVVDPANTANALTGIVSLNAVASTTCAVLVDGTARCWGRNSLGQVGNNTTVNSKVPVSVVDPTNTANALTGIANISAGDNQTCARMSDGTARCWGYNSSGQLGNNTTVNSKVPVTVVDPTNNANALTGIASISAGANQTCARMSDGTARCWGYNYYGQLGNNTNTDSKVPVTVVDPTNTANALSGITSISSGYKHTCALKADSSARCWGENSFGELGNNTTMNSPVPVKVSGI